MCGIVGVHTNVLSQKELNAFETLMTVSNLRGYQGAGIAAAMPSGDIREAKVLSNGVTLLSSKNYIDIIRSPVKTMPHTMIGHTRWPTKGAVELPFVHPHNKKNCIGVHNGTMTSVGHNFVKPSQSDSSMIYDLISDKGIDEMYQTSYGAFCLVWIDKGTKTLNFIRNSERPLFLAYVGHKIRDDDGAKANCLFWASERLFLDFALIRSGFTGENTYIEELPVDTLVAFDLEKRGVIEPLEVRKLEKKSRTFQGWNSSANQTTPFNTAAGQEKFPWRTWEKLGNNVFAGEGCDHGIVINSWVVKYNTPGIEVHVCEYADGSRSRSNCPPTYWKALEDSRGNTTSTAVVVKSAEESASVFYDDNLEDVDLLDEDLDGLEDAAEVVGEADVNEMFDKFMDKVNFRGRNFSGHAMETLKGNFVSRKDFYKYISSGCSYCNSNSVNPRNVVWHTKTDYLCEKCQLDEEARAMCFLHPLKMN